MQNHCNHTHNLLFHYVPTMLHFIFKQFCPSLASTNRPTPALRRQALTLCLITMLAYAPPGFSQGTAILIIDDMGNGWDLGYRALQLPGKINYAFLPHTPNSRQLADLANQRGQEVLLHLPMSNLNGAATGPGKLSPKLDQQQFNDVIADNLKAIPHVRGVNNHMGSLLTQLHQPMQWLMQALKQHEMYFIDSRTSPLTVAERTARAQQLPTLHRDVFLDNDLSHEAIEKSVQRWMKEVQSQGLAVAIAHPHPQTLEVLEKMLPKLEQHNIRLALISEVLPGKATAKPPEKLTTATTAALKTPASNL